jgi:branched-subunit amino acid transport protein
MSDTLWVILGMAVVTYATRASLLLAGGRVHLSPRLEQALRYLPVALLTAIVVPALLVRNDALALTWRNDYLWAGIVCIVVAWRTKNVLWTVLTGLLFVLAWRTFGL